MGAVEHDTQVVKVGAKAVGWGLEQEGGGGAGGGERGRGGGGSDTEREGKEWGGGGGGVACRWMDFAWRAGRPSALPHLPPMRARAGSARASDGGQRDW